MPKIQDYTRQRFGIWEVLEKTDRRNKSSGCIIYKVKNLKDNTICYIENRLDTMDKKIDTLRNDVDTLRKDFEHVVEVNRLTR